MDTHTHTHTCYAAQGSKPLRAGDAGMGSASFLQQGDGSDSGGSDGEEGACSTLFLIFSK